MQHSMKTGILSAFTAGVMALGLSFTPAPAHAISKLQLSEGITSIEIADGGGGDLNSTAGAVTFIGNVGAFNITNVTTGISKPAIGAANNPHMDLNSVNVSGGAGTLTIMFTDTDFTDLAAGLNGLQALIGGTTAGTVTYETWLGATNGEFEMTTKLTELGGFSSGAFSGTTSLPFSPTGPYSLTQIVTITHTGNGVSSFDAELKAVPEPGTIFLFGSGLMGLRRNSPMHGTICFGVNLISRNGSHRSAGGQRGYLPQD